MTFSFSFMLRIMQANDPNYKICAITYITRHENKGSFPPMKEWRHLHLFLL